MIRLVGDPGVFISALIGRPGSPSDQIVQAWIDGRIELIASPALLAELRRVIARPKFRRWFDELTARQLAERIDRHAPVLPDVAIPPTTRVRPREVGRYAANALLSLLRGDTLPATVRRGRSRLSVRASTAGRLGGHEARGRGVGSRAAVAAAGSIPHGYATAAMDG